MNLSASETFRSIFELWKKTYISLLPLTVLVTLCLDSTAIFDSIILAILLCIPGLYLSNVILLKLANVFRQELPRTEEEFYSLALKRFPDALMLFLGLGGIFLLCFLLASSILGFLFGLVVIMLLLLIYSYLIFAYPLVVIDGLDPVQSLKKSFHLINNHIGYITVIFLVIGLVEAIAYVIFYLIAGMAGASLIYNLIFTTLNLVLSVVVLESLKSKQLNK
ncbi:MAG TPA: hypothetical protein VGU44_04350 [Gammaproteobacteria bacterium]|nr:hypothetical protein [Gammaproteobacteria bacterium]HEV2613076.1 hypothetical protein [Gammaproteobacteria bacterium]